MKKLVVVFILLIVITGACRKSNSKTVISVDEDISAHFLFKPGTYWVYQDALTGDIDSCYVWQNIFDPFYVLPYSSNQVIYNIEDIVITKCDPYDTLVLQMSLLANTIDFSYDNRANYAPFITYPFKIGFIYPPSIPDINVLGEPNDSGEVISIFPSYFLNGQTFDSVAEITHISYSANSYYYNDTFFLSSGEGIIKMNLHHPSATTNNQNRVWELQRFNITR